MARPQDYKKHGCTYCLKYPLHGRNRHYALNDHSGERVPVCKTCKNYRSKWDLSHEAMLRRKMRRAKKHVELMEYWLAELCRERNNYSLDFRLEFALSTSKIIAEAEKRELEQGD